MIFNLNFEVTLSETEMLALIEVINRSHEIKRPDLMYYKTLLSLENKLLKEVDKVCGI